MIALRSINLLKTLFLACSSSNTRRSSLLYLVQHKHNRDKEVYSKMKMKLTATYHGRPWATEAWWKCSTPKIDTIPYIFDISRPRRDILSRRSKSFQDIQFLKCERSQDSTMPITTMPNIISYNFAFVCQQDNSKTWWQIWMKIFKGWNVSLPTNNLIMVLIGLNFAAVIYLSRCSLVIN